MNSDTYRLISVLEYTKLLSECTNCVCSCYACVQTKQKCKICVYLLAVSDVTRGALCCPSQQRHQSLFVPQVVFLSLSWAPIGHPHSQNQAVDWTPCPRHRPIDQTVFSHSKRDTHTRSYTLHTKSFCA